jgi:hypothetical protein
MRRVARLLIPAVFALAIAGSAAASGSGMTVEVSQSHRVLVRGAIANVIVGDPTVADVVMIDAHSVIVVGKGYGSTQVMVIDRAGHALLDTRVTVTARNDGRVTVYRGAASTDYSCAGRCQAVATPGGSASPSGGAASPAASMAATATGSP